MNQFTDSRSQPGAKEGGPDDRALMGGGNGLSPQCTLVLEYLQSGRALTNLIAITNLGVGSLSSRVAELRTLGYDIVGTPKTDFSGQSYTSYTLGASTS